MSSLFLYTNTNTVNESSGNYYSSFHSVYHSYPKPLACISSHFKIFPLAGKLTQSADKYHNTHYPPIYTQANSTLHSLDCQRARSNHSTTLNQEEKRLSLTSPKRTPLHSDNRITLQSPRRRISRRAKHNGFVARACRDDVHVLACFLGLDGGADGEVFCGGFGAEDGDGLCVRLLSI